MKVAIRILIVFVITVFISIFHFNDVSASSPLLVKDIYEGPSGSTPYTFVSYGTGVYFTANELEHGWELWKSDGTEVGTQLVKDVYTGDYSSSPSNLVMIGSTLYFSAVDETSGRELWKSDGTTEGTVMVKDIFSGTDSSSPSEFVVVGSYVYFRAFTPEHGWELWKSDGTEGGTTLVKDIFPGVQDSNPYNFVSLNGVLFFGANDGVHSTELWKSNGTEEGTVLIKDIYLGSEPSSPDYIVAMAGNVYFRAVDAVHGYELWKSDGSEVGTILLKDIMPGEANSSAPENLINAEGTLFFDATDGVAGFELWKSDGTEEGTVMVKDINVSSHSYPRNFTALGPILYFSALTSDGGRHLWKSNGTEEGTVMVKNTNYLTGDSEIQGITAYGNTLYFSALSQEQGYELWRTDGTTERTVLVADIIPGSNSSEPEYLTGTSVGLFFTANDGTHGTELMKLPLDTSPPILSSLSLLSGSILSDATPNISFIIDEYATCRVGLSDVGFDEMTTTCSEGFAKTSTCITPNLGGPGAKTIHLSCKDLDENKDTAETNEDISVTIPTVTVYESADVAVTPSSPGVQFLGSMSPLLVDDALRFRTANSLVEGGYDSQIYKFSLNSTGLQLPKLTFSWNGYGEQNSAYPVVISIWNFSTSAWETISTQACSVDCTMSSIKQGSKYIGNGLVWVWVKAMNQYILPVITNLSSGTPTGSDTTISWETDIASTTELAYGKTSQANWEDYEFHETVPGTGLTHEVFIDGLEMGAEYFFRVRSNGATDDYTTSEEYSFWAIGSSCPYIFSYNGASYKFVTEASSPGILSLGTKRVDWATNPFYKTTFYPNPLGNATIPNGNLVPRTVGDETFYDLRATFELNEVNYLDEAALLVYDHSADVEIYPDYRQNGVMHSMLKNSAVPFSVIDQSGKNVKNKVSKEDNDYWQSPLSSTPSYLEIKLLESNVTPENLKFVIKKGKEGDFFNSMPGDKLQFKNESGNFEDVPASYNIFYSKRDGALAGSIIVSNMSGLETKVVDLSGLTIKDNTIRLVTTNDKTQWDIDWIAVDTSPDALGTITKLSPYSANLHARGVSDKELSVPNNDKIYISQPKYSKAALLSRPANPLSGNATKFGEVSPLLSSVDNKFVVLVQGDELSLRYEVPTQGQNTERDFIYNTWDYHKPYLYALGAEIGPLPFNEMTKYPYNTSVENYPYSANQAYLDEYNTRTINWVNEPYIPDLHHSLNTDFVSILLQEAYSAPSVTPTSTVSPRVELPTQTPVPSIETEKEYLNNYSEYLLGEGKLFELKKKQTVYFLVNENEGQEEHSATVTEIGTDYVDLSIASTPIRIRLGIQEEKLIDVTEDGQMDISIKLDAITNGFAKLTFSQVLAVTPSPTTTALPTVTVAIPAKLGKNTNWWLYLLLLIVFVGGISLATKKREK